MGQEKSIPVRCNTCHDYSSSAPIKRSLSRSTSSSSTTKSSTATLLSTTASINTTKTSTSSQSTALSTTTSSSFKSIDKQTQYLNHQLYIKTYLDILEEDQNAKVVFQPVRKGIRNYTPKILVEKTAAAATTTTVERNVDVWI